MTAVQITAVDERDSSWEDDHPHFRVYLQGVADGATSTYDVTGADLLQVIDWAQDQAGDTRTYAIALVVDDQARESLHPGDGRGLVWLIGTDANSTSDLPGDLDVQSRMRARRTAPVGIPVQDRMPTSTHVDDLD